ncbi:DNA-binding response OmpR family regulator [Xanthomonas arboricola]|uniref:winged helix-turn-helix domain-containing protein n=1 Tax=Xanthomonas TaxID=338 RepID=UPI000C863962|nr:response regulator transcription factor [Xanthomonas arboricola]MBB3760731.1 DNA-binding response OmpR family regulator [Xanthomonas arboricola]MBB4726829.1 DNA-binding response OmpR family regulator [Xanthomonas arboricola]MBB5675807.1 DNA-binding response OmpR family regulator [Xanthomonas arboricola]MBB5859671.1 DNA-binding response OmpR family regulator [Xanthomonas arboricola]MBB6337097.1 DNA-binding response OmpR family regulator [Xanthomonas arboricola]
MHGNLPGKHGSAFLLTQDARLASQVNASLAPLAPSFAVFSDELELLRSLRHSPCELLIFDATCVASDDSSLLAWQRCHSGHPTPLIVLGRFDCAHDILAWYRAGAHDVLALPFNSHELHVRAALALSPVAEACPESQQLSVGPYQLIRDENTVYLHGKPIVLTAREFSIAWLLFSSPGVCFRRCQLAKAVWGSHTEFTDRTMEQHIYKLRKKLQLCNHSGVVRIRTVYSHGYKLELALQDKDAPTPGKVVSPSTGHHAAAC